jgi:protein TonB
MSDTPRTAASARRASRGQTHLLLDRPADPSFDFEDQHLGGLLGASVLSHVAMVIIAILVLRYMPRPQLTEIVPDQMPDEIVWLAEEGPGGGGGGGGNNSPEPPRKVELPGKEKVSVPVEVEPEPVKKEPPKEEPPQETLIPAAQTAAAPVEAPGAITPETIVTSPSAGSGTGGGGGTGEGGGSGAGNGRGLGSGNTAGVGGGEFDIGNGVSSPRVIREVKPAYTAEAMRAKVQGVVWLRCVVGSDGTVGRVEVVRSLDTVFGLDQEAVKAARQWRFVPGMRLGEPVAVRITIELTFTLR